jgi:hypothetical protein
MTCRLQGLSGLRVERRERVIHHKDFGVDARRPDV